MLEKYWLRQVGNNMHIELHVFNTSVGLKLFALLGSYLQSKNSPIYEKNLTINFGPIREISKEPNTINVLFTNMPYYCRADLDSYDFVFFSNADEPLHVATGFIAKNLSRKNCYIIANSILEESHVLRNKVLTSFEDILMCNQYWRSPNYPMYYINSELQKKAIKNKSVMFINGQMRTWRQSLFNSFKKHNVDIPISANISTDIQPTLESHWESKEDKEFRSAINSIDTSVNNQKNAYYDNAIEVGFDVGFEIPGTENKPNKIPFGYFILPEYYEYHCIIFFETTWKNNELSITEKACKCFYTKTIPWPVGGANLNKLYNSIGFKTAWNLLPAEHQMFDSELNHIKRYDLMAQAVKWLTEHPDVLTGKNAELIKKQNREWFLDNNLWEQPVNALLEILKSSKK